jgi:hypothetical protein
MYDSREVSMPERSLDASAARYGGPDDDCMARVLNLQALEVAEEDPWIGNSNQSSGSSCCNN